MITKIKIITYGSSGAAIWFGYFTTNEFAALVGASVAVLSMIGNLAITWYFKSQHLKLARQRIREDE